MSKLREHSKSHQGCGFHSNFTPLADQAVSYQRSVGANLLNKSLVLLNQGANNTAYRVLLRLMWVRRHRSPPILHQGRLLTLCNMQDGVANMNLAECILFYSRCQDWITGSGWQRRKLLSLQDVAHCLFNPYKS